VASITITYPDELAADVQAAAAFAGYTSVEEAAAALFRGWLTDALARQAAADRQAALAQAEADFRAARAEEDAALAGRLGDLDVGVVVDAPVEPPVEVVTDPPAEVTPAADAQGG
jgi:hypothetical protein